MAKQLGHELSVVSATPWAGLVAVSRSASAADADRGKTA
jgi:hypothetical protein